MKESARPDFHDEENVDQLKCRRYHNEEIAGNDGIGVIAHKRHPTLLWVGGPLRRFGHVVPNRPRGNLYADLQQQLISNAFYTPGRVARCHLDDQLLQLGGNARSSTRSGLVFPKQTEALAMPTDQGIGFDDGEGIPPVEKTRQSSQCKADRIWSSGVVLLSAR